MDKEQAKQGDRELVLVALEGEIANLEKLLTCARECGFRKLLSAATKDLQKSGAEAIEIVAMAATEEPRERLHAD
jgi:hypothetical protein